MLKLYGLVAPDGSCWLISIRRVTCSPSRISSCGSSSNVLPAAPSRPASPGRSTAEGSLFFMSGFTILEKVDLLVGLVSKPVLMLWGSYELMMQ